MVHVSVERAESTVLAVLLRLGAPVAAASLQRDLLIAAELRGHPSHGVMRLRRIVERVLAGVTNLSATGEQRWVGSALLEVDGQQGLGPVVAMSTLATLRDRVGQSGVVAATIRNSDHIGMLSWYVEQVAREGYTMIATCTSEALVHPWGGRDRMIGTNPLAMGVPAADHPLILDMATGVVSMGKIHDHASRGLAIPEGWALDQYGAPTTSAQAAIDGSVSPFGGPKGYALGLALEVIVAGLTRTALGTEVHGTLDSTFPSTKGDVFIIFEKFQDDIVKAIGTYLELIRSGTPAEGHTSILVPGDRARASCAAKMEQGIDIPDDVWRDIEALAELDLGLVVFEDR